MSRHRRQTTSYPQGSDCHYPVENLLLAVGLSVCLAQGAEAASYQFTPTAGQLVTGTE